MTMARLLLHLCPVEYFKVSWVAQKTHVTQKGA